MSELQPGMLAMVIGTTGNHPEFIGRIVELEERIDCPYGKGWSWDYDEGGPIWNLDEHLLPLPPLADPLEITEKDVLHA